MALQHSGVHFALIKGYLATFRNYVAGQGDGPGKSTLIDCNLYSSPKGLTDTNQPMVLIG